MEINDKYQKILERNKFLRNNIASLSEIYNQIINNITTVELKDVMSPKIFHSLIDRFYSSTGISVGIMHTNGELHLGKNRETICKYILKTKDKSDILCTQSIKIIINNMDDKKGYVIYKCGYGIYNIAIPIKVKKKVIAYFLINQFMMKEEPIDTEYFEKQAKYHNFDKEEYIKSINKIKKYSKQEVSDLILFFKSMVKLLAEYTLRKIILSIHVDNISGLVPICSNCKKIRDDKGYWEQLESYIEKQTKIVFSKGICPKCKEKEIKQKNELGKTLVIDLYDKELIKNKKLEKDYSLINRRLHLENFEKTPLDKTVDINKTLDIPQFDALMTLFYNVTKIPFGLADSRGKMLIVTGWQNVCKNFFRTNVNSSGNCVVDDTKAQNRVKQDQKTIIYKCKNGLREVASPLIIDNKTIGTIHLGQFFFKEDLNNTTSFRDIGKRNGFEEDEFLNAIKEVRVYTTKQITEYIKFYKEFIIFLSSYTIQSVKISNQINILSELIPICNSCKKVRDDTGCWSRIEKALESKSTANFTHGICPECTERLYGNQEWYKQKKTNL